MALPQKESSWSLAVDCRPASLKYTGHERLGPAPVVRQKFCEATLRDPAWIGVDPPARNTRLPEKVSALTSSSHDVPARRILVVDDNVGAAKMLAMLLKRLGPHEVETAHDGPSTIEKADRFHPEIILLDIGLPRMDGLAVACALRESGNHDGTLLAALTGYGQEEDRQRSKEAGFDEHLVKPVGVETLQQLLGHPKLAGI